MEITLWDYTGDLNRLEAVDSAGRALPLQLVSDSPKQYWDHRYVTVYVRVAVPALGYTAIALREKPLERCPVYRLNDVRVDAEMGGCVLENEVLRAQFDARSGALVSLIDKETGEEQLAAPAQLCLVDTEKATSDAWHIGRWLRCTPVGTVIRFSPQSGSVRNCLEIRQKVLSSTVITRVSLDSGARELCFALEIDWNEAAGQGDTVPLLTFRAPVKSRPDRFLCDVPGGLIWRKEGHIDMPCQSFAAAENGQNLLTLAADCKYGYRLSEGTLTCSLINTAGSPDPYPERGLHRITLWLRAGKETPAALRRHIEALNRPLIPLSTKAQPGPLPARMRLLHYEADTALLSGAELNGQGEFCLRVYETQGQRDTVRLSLPFEAATARLTDMKGRDMETARVQGRQITFEAAPFRLTEVRVTPMDKT